MAYAVVTFYDDYLVSEVPTNWLHKDGDDYLCWWPPTNVKNVPVLISKRVDPDCQTWKLVEVNVEKYCRKFFFIFIFNLNFFSIFKRN